MEKWGLDWLNGRSSSQVHVANGFNKTVRAIVKDVRDGAAESSQTLRPGQVMKHRSTGWTNFSQVHVRVIFENGEESVNTENNRSIIITSSGSLVEAHYSSWFVPGGYSSVWRDTIGTCHNPFCPRNRNGECNC